MRLFLLKRPFIVSLLSLNVEWNRLERAFNRPITIIIVKLDNLYLHPSYLRYERYYVSFYFLYWQLEKTCPCSQTLHSVNICSGIVWNKRSVYLSLLGLEVGGFGSDKV